MRFRLVILFCLFQLVVLITPTMDLGNTTNLESDDPISYINAYLVQFPNLTLGEVLTVIDVESGFNPNLISIEHSVHDKSYGPMQVRSKTAKLACKFTSPIEDLCSWKYGLYCGMQFLSWKKDEAVRSAKNAKLRQERMWAGYNAGTFYMIKKGGKWRYRNEAYVNKCRRAYDLKYKRFDDGTATEVDNMVLAITFAVKPQKRILKN